MNRKEAIEELLRLRKELLEKDKIRNNSFSEEEKQNKEHKLEKVPLSYNQHGYITLGILSSIVLLLAIISIIIIKL